MSQKISWVLSFSVCRPIQNETKRSKLPWRSCDNGGFDSPDERRQNENLPESTSTIASFRLRQCWQLIHRPETWPVQVFLPCDWSNPQPDFRKKCLMCNTIQNLKQKGRIETFQHFFRTPLKQRCNATSAWARTSSFLCKTVYERCIRQNYGGAKGVFFMKRNENGNKWAVSHNTGRDDPVAVFWQVCNVQCSVGLKASRI